MVGSWTRPILSADGSWALLLPRARGHGLARFQHLEEPPRRAPALVGPLSLQQPQKTLQRTGRGRCLWVGHSGYIEQEIRDVFCCWLNRPPLHIFKEKKKKERMKRERTAWESHGDDIVISLMVW